MTGRRVARERLQSAVNHAILLGFLLIVVFPFYWMTVTAFKSEDQMRSLASMFWPSPFVGDNFAHLLRKTEFLGWYGNSIVVAFSSTFLATAVATSVLVTATKTLFWYQFTNSVFETSCP